MLFYRERERKRLMWGQGVGGGGAECGDGFFSQSSHPSQNILQSGMLTLDEKNMKNSNFSTPILKSQCVCCTYHILGKSPVIRDHRQKSNF